MEKTFWNRVNNKELLEQVSEGKEVIWINENQEKTADALAKINITMADIDDAEARLARFAPFIKKVFPETEPQNGLPKSLICKNSWKKNIPPPFPDVYS